MHAPDREQPACHEYVESGGRAKEEFDLVFSNATLYWVKDHNRLLKNCFRCLRKDGMIRFSFAAEGNFTCSHFFKVIKQASSRLLRKNGVLSRRHRCCKRLARIMSRMIRTLGPNHESRCKQTEVHLISGDTALSNYVGAPTSEDHIPSRAVS